MNVFVLSHTMKKVKKKNRFYFNKNKKEKTETKHKQNTQFLGIKKLEFGAFSKGDIKCSK